jgi:hypothetical protein
MMGRMNKHINSLSMRTLMKVEKKEHGMKNMPTKKGLPAMEMKEHGLKSRPSMSQIMQMERKEHLKGGKVVIGKGAKGN